MIRALPVASSLMLALTLTCSAQALLETETGAKLFRLPNGATFEKATSDQGRSAAYQQPLEFVFPEFIIGGEWTSTLKLSNRGTAALPATSVFFVDNLGKALRATFQIGTFSLTDVGFSVALAAGSVIEVTFTAPSSTQFGYVFIGTCNASGVCISGIYGEVILKNKNATRPDFESVFPLEQPVDLQYMLWDHRTGFSTVLYLVNTNTTATTVTLDLRNSSNQLVKTLTVSLQPSESQILTLHALAPETIGAHGVLVIRGQNSSGSTALIVATALRINPSNSFTPMRAFVPKL